MFSTLVVPKLFLENLYVHLTCMEKKLCIFLLCLLAMTLVISWSNLRVIYSQEWLKWSFILMSGDKHELNKLAYLTVGGKT